MNSDMNRSSSPLKRARTKHEPKEIAMYTGIFRQKIQSFQGLTVKEEGRMFVRNICMAFDLRLIENKPDTRVFSMTI